MSTSGNNALDNAVAALKAATLVEGNVFRDSAGAAVTASKPVYVDSSSQVQTGDIPFAATMAGVIVSGLLSTAVSALDVTGQSNPGSANTLMQGQLVVGSRVTTFTKTGFIQVNITDSAGNITDGVHYIQIGTLS